MTMSKHVCLIGCLLLVLSVVPILSTKSVFHLLKQTKQRVKHVVQCVPPSKYFAGSCYTYMKTSPAPSWEGAFNNCQSLPTATDASLSAIETIEEYEFIERELIGLKSGSESVSVYIGLRKINNTWLWSNQIPLKETDVYRFWVDNNRDILAYDCGILWLARNTSVLTPAPCIEQALRPFVCKHTIDRCFNNSVHCGKYGTCLNLPTNNSYKCQCRFLYRGDRCEKWSYQGIQILVGLALIVVVLFVSISMKIFQSKKKISSKFVRTRRSSFSLFQMFKRRQMIFIVLAVILTTIFFVVIFSQRNSFDENLKNFHRLVEFCSLYENDFYSNLVTLPLSSAILLIIILNELRLKRRFPTPFNPFNKVKRIDSTILCGLISSEIVRILSSMIFISSNGPLADLIRQIGLIMIVALKFYPVYVTIEIEEKNFLYSGLSAFYIVFDFSLRIFGDFICSKRRNATVFGDSTTLKLVENLPFYFCSIYVFLRLIYFFFISFSRCKNDDERNSTRNSLKHIYHEPTANRSIENLYVQNLFDSNGDKTKYFRFSKQIFHLYFIAFLLVYSLTLNIFKSPFVLMPIFLIYEHFDLPESNSSNFQNEIIFATFFTSFICFSQLIFGLKTYRRHVLDAYRGISIDLPSRLSLNRSKQMFKHIHYAGYFIAYSALFYILLVNVLFISFVLLRLISAQIFLIEDAAKFLVPLFLIYLSTNFIHWFLSRTFLIETNEKFLSLKNLRFYFVLNYFNFFFDCWIGMISCAVRTIKASILALIFYSRLDYSIFGRNFEKNDSTFVSYASFIYVECLHTHPVLIFFTSIVQQQIDERNRYRILTKKDSNFYAYRQRIQFRWFLALTLSRNRNLIVERKFSSSRSKVKTNFHREIFDRSIIYRNDTTTCTTLLLEIDERKRTF